MKSLIASTALLAIMSVSGFFIFKTLQFEQMNKIERLNYLWSRDMQALGKTQHIHKGWNSIKETEAFAGSKLAKQWLDKLKLPTQTKKDGKYKLEILLLDFQDENCSQAVIQMNLVELSSKNMVWELGRTYKLDSYWHMLLY